MSLAITDAKLLEAVEKKRKQHNSLLKLIKRTREAITLAKVLGNYNEQCRLWVKLERLLPQLSTIKMEFVALRDEME